MDGSTAEADSSQLLEKGAGYAHGSVEVQLVDVDESMSPYGLFFASSLNGPPVRRVIRPNFPTYKAPLRSLALLLGFYNHAIPVQPVLQANDNRGDPANMIWMKLIGAFSY